MFHGELQNDHEAIANEERAYVPIPQVRKVSPEDMQENYMNIKRDIQDLVKAELFPCEARTKEYVKKLGVLFGRIKKLRIRASVK